MMSTSTVFLFYFLLSEFKYVSSFYPTTQSLRSASPARKMSSSTQLHHSDPITSSSDSSRSPTTFNRKSFFDKIAVFSAIPATMSVYNNEANAAPPMAVIAEELGYFPVTNKLGETTYIPARVKRHSTDQAIELSKFLKEKGVTMYGAFWCPHCQRQKEMFGREAWDIMNYVECDRRGMNGNAAMCLKDGVDGFPTFKYKNGKELAGGEMPLERIAKLSGFKGVLDGSLEPDLPVSSGSCKQ